MQNIEAHWDSKLEARRNWVDTENWFFENTDFI